jgi:hypothetical protein
MTAPDIIPSAAAMDPAPVDVSDGLRLRLRDSGAVGGSVDGGWWPRTLDLRVELPPLLAEMYSADYDIHRVTYNVTGWDRAPHTVNVAGHLVKLAGYHAQNVATISLMDTSGCDGIDLVVVPPGTDAVVAGRALAVAGRDGDLHQAAEILQRANRPTTTRLSRTGCLDDLPFVS